jgi:integrase
MECEQQSESAKRQSRRVRLTDTWIDRRKVENGRQEDWFDTGQPGLILRISYGGARTFRTRYKTDSGKTHTFKLGRWHPKTFNVAMAREAARKFDYAKVKPKGVSTDGLTDDQKWWATATFKEVAEKYLAEVVANFRSRKETERCLRVYAIPALGDKIFTEIKKSEVSLLRRKMRSQNGPRQADVVFALVRSVMMWVEDDDVLDDYASPLRYRPKKRGRNRQLAGGRDRVLDDDELRMIWAAASQMGQFGGLIKLLLLTAQRRQCLATARWSEIKDGTWYIRKEPGEAKGTAEILKLPPLALEILNGLPRIKDNPYVFGVVHKGEHKPFNSFSQRGDELKALLPREIPRWTLHDLRRTARTRMEDIGIDMQTGEVVLGHALPGVKRTYIRSTFKDKKADALLRLSEHIASIVNAPSPGDKTAPAASTPSLPENVVPIAHARRR